MVDVIEYKQVQKLTIAVTFIPSTNILVITEDH